MPSSYELVNYSLRPAKAAERKMLCEIIRRLEPFNRVETYRYVGFGSIYFADFHLFHQNLGISDMVSIEKDEVNKPRFEFNKPFRCVELRLGHSNSVLPQLNWDKRCVFWLDYDGKLDKSVLADLATVCSGAVSGSLLVVSVNVEPDRKPGATPQERALIAQDAPQPVGGLPLYNDIPAALASLERLAALRPVDHLLLGHEPFYLTGDAAGKYLAEGAAFIRSVHHQVERARAQLGPPPNVEALTREVLDGLGKQAVPAVPMICQSIEAHLRWRP